MHGSARRLDDFLPAALRSGSWREGPDIPAGDVIEHPLGTLRRIGSSLRRRCLLLETVETAMSRVLRLFVEESDVDYAPLIEEIAQFEREEQPALDRAVADYRSSIRKAEALVAPGSGPAGAILDEAASLAEQDIETLIGVLETLRDTRLALIALQSTRSQRQTRTAASRAGQ